MYWVLFFLGRYGSFCINRNGPSQPVAAPPQIAANGRQMAELEPALAPCTQAFLWPLRTVIDSFSFLWRWPFDVRLFCDVD